MPIRTKATKTKKATKVKKATKTGDKRPPSKWIKEVMDVYEEFKKARKQPVTNSDGKIVINVYGLAMKEAKARRNRNK